jgi:hypothetical protein
MVSGSAVAPGQSWAAIQRTRRLSTFHSLATRCKGSLSPITLFFPHVSLHRSRSSELLTLNVLNAIRVTRRSTSRRIQIVWRRPSPDTVLTFWRERPRRPG